MSPSGSLAHALWHTYAMLLADAGASLPEVQELLGHADLSTTQVYLKAAGRGLKEAALPHPARALLRRAGPVEKKQPRRTRGGVPLE